MAALLSLLFPFQQGISSFPAQANGDDAIFASILQIMSTKKGERPGRPSFGTDVMDYIFENNSDNTNAGLEREVKTALATWEPRIAVQSVVTTVDDLNEPGQILMTISYVILQTGSTNSVTIGIG